MRQRFTAEFIREAVRLAETSGRTQREIAEDLGIGLTTLTRWLSMSFVLKALRLVGGGSRD